MLLGQELTSLVLNSQKSTTIRQSEMGEGSGKSSMVNLSITNHLATNLTPNQVAVGFKTTVTTSTYLPDSVPGLMLAVLRVVTLGARGHLPSGYMVSSLWVLKQFAHPIPTGYRVSTFEKYSPMCPSRTWATHWEFFQKVLSHVITTYPPSFFQRTHKELNMWLNFTMNSQRTHWVCDWVHCDHMGK